MHFPINYQTPVEIQECLEILGGKATCRLHRMTPNADKLYNSKICHIPYWSMPTMIATGEINAYAIRPCRALSCQKRFLVSYYKDDICLTIQYACLKLPCNFSVSHNAYSNHTFDQLSYSLY
jgi:hypothetical protein